MRALRIAQIAPVGRATRRGASESIHQLVALLCDGLVARGHEVTLFATADSTTSAKLRYCFRRGYADEPELWDWQFAEYVHVGQAYARAAEFDVMHCHSYHFGVPFAQFVSVPNVHTHHVETEPLVLELYKRLPQVQLVAVSDFQARAYSGCPNVELIPHGVDVGSFPFGETGGKYLLFLGRMIDDKGPVKAIEIARQARMPLVLAGPAEDGFDTRIAPLIDGSDVSYAGEVNSTERDRLLAGAAALLYPLLYPEPFGLVPVEAMACGTPVVGVGIGALPELVETGLTGYLAPSWDRLAELLPPALDLDRHAIRERAIQRFDYKRMVDAHEALYRRLAEGMGS